MDSQTLHTLIAGLNWRAGLNAAVVQIGEALVRAGRLEELVHTPTPSGVDVLRGRFAEPGDVPRVCEVRLTKTTGRQVIEPRCECPFGERCQHVAAMLYMIESQPPQQWAKQALVVWDRWFQSLARTSGILVPAEAGRQLGLLLRAESERGHRYLRGLGENEPALHASALLAAPVWLRPGKRGDKLVDPQSLRLGRKGPEPAPPEGWHPDVEAALNLLLHDASERHGNLAMTRVHQRYHEQAIRQLAGHMPVYFERASDGPLTEGEPQALTLTWHDLPDGSQRLEVESGAASTRRLLRGASLWYVDTEERRFGSVDTDPDILDALDRMPALRPEQVADFQQRAHALTLPVALPEPTRREPVQVIDTAPRPVLRLRQLATQSDWHRLAGRTETPRLVGCARLSFDYGPVRLDPFAYPPQSRRLIGQTVYQVERKTQVERQAIDALGELGMVDPELVMYDVGLSESDIAPSDFVLRPKGKGMPLTPDEWQPVLTKLAEADFQLEYEDDFPRDDLVEVGDWLAEIDPDGNAWFQLSLGIDIGGERIDLLPILRRLLADPNFPLRATKTEKPDAVWRVRLDNQRSIELPLARLRALIEPLLEWLQTERGPSLRLHRSQAESMAGLPDLQWRGDAALRQALDRQRATANTTADAPPGFTATLRPYQREGLAWLDFLAEAKLGGILADDMGLGKTVQVLAHLLSEKQRGRLDRPALVVFPTSLVGNWFDEAARFAPDLRVLVVHGAGRADAYEAIGENDLVITTYPLLPRDKDRLAEHTFSLLILDEAQAIKNARSQAAQVVRQITAERRLAMTGTPLENHLGELWAQFDAVEPGLLGSERQFTRLYRSPIEKHGDSEQQKRLNARIGPLLLRRRKDDVLTDLPAKTEIVRRIELDGDQRALYETLRLAQHERIREAITERGLAQSGIVVLDALLKLRQACCDPGLVKLEGARKVKGSAKREALHELLEGLLAEDRRVLLFSQFTEMLGLLEADLKRLGVPFMMLTGDTPSQNRADLVRRFQAGDTQLFLISLKAGGVGLNLTAADTVIHYDPWWNPAVENQATDRAHRIGQDKPVFVYKLICTGTVEEKIQALQARKSDLAQAVLEGGSSQRLRFDEGDLDALFAPLV